MRLDDRRLNRATLARQGLSDRLAFGVTEAIERVGGLQAQEPATPYVALWTRLEDFDPDALSRALHERDVVKAVLHRSTLHLVSADDYAASITAIAGVTRTRWMSEQRGRPVLRELPELTEAALDHAASPRTNIEMREFSGTLGEPVEPDELWRRIRRYGGFLAVPEASAWSFGRRPVHVAARSWIDLSPLDEADSLAHVVRRHLVGFGPARLADIAQWSGIGIRRLARGAALLEDVETHEDAAGNELLDLAGLPLPEAGVAVPPRLLPMWDETLLAYRDRSRVLPEAYRKRVIAPNGDVLPTFIVDGRVAGLWWAEQPVSDGDPNIVLEPFEALSNTERAALEGEARKLASMLSGREPAVYARYRR